MTRLDFRKATQADAETLVEFIKALAAHEGRPEAATLSLNDLGPLLFDECKIADAYLGFVGGQVAGFVIVSERFSSFNGKRSLYLDDMLLVDTFRGQGLGGQLFAFVADLAVKGNYSGLNWSAVAGNDIAIGFYNHIKAESEKDVLHFSMTAPKLKQLLESK